MHYRQFGLKLMYMLFSTGFTIVMVPYNGLLPDMVDDYTVRAKFSSVRMMFSAFGAILAGLVPTLMIRDNTNAGQYLTVALIFGVIFLVTILIIRRWGHLVVWFLFGILLVFLFGQL